MDTWEKCSYSDKELCERIEKAILRAEMRVGRKKDDVGRITPYVSPEYHEYLDRIFQNNLKEKAEALVFPSVLWKALLFYIPVSRISGINVNKRVEIARNIITTISYLRKDVFCENKENVMNNYEPSIGDKRFKAGILKSFLFMYSELAFAQFHNYVKEIHGPYEMNGFKVMVYSHPRLNEVPEFLPKISARNVEIVSVFSEIKVNFDVYNNYWYKEKHIHDCVFIDGKEVSEEKYKKILEKIRSAIQEGVHAWKEMDINEKVRTRIWQMWHALHPIAEISRISSEPPESVLKKLMDFKPLPLVKVEERFFNLCVD